MWLPRPLVGLLRPLEGLKRSPKTRVMFLDLPEDLEGLLEAAEATCCFSQPSERLLRPFKGDLKGRKVGGSSVRGSWWCFSTGWHPEVFAFLTLHQCLCLFPGPTWTFFLFVHFKVTSNSAYYSPLLLQPEIPHYYLWLWVRSTVISDPTAAQMLHHLCRQRWSCW